MTTPIDTTLTHRRITSGDARVATFRRTYDAPIADLWDACTNPDRLARWYVPVSGDLHVGGAFRQEMMGGGTIAECDAPSFLRLVLGSSGADEIELRLTPGDAPDTTVLELQHATTIDQHEIGGQMFDAVYCMGGGYFPRLAALELHLRDALPDDYDTLTFYQRADVQPISSAGMAQMQALLDADTAPTA
ncbi:MAG: hypothetical protein JWM25_919 [Thermoleophilia bacterium]|nr:hypothetical protein [Thermoleophilia bacterium]